MPKLKIGLMDTKVFNPNRYISNSIYRAARSEAANFNFETVYCTYSSVMKNVKQKEIDLLILLDGSGLNSNFFLHISKYIPIFVWTFDDPFDLDNTLDCIDFITKVYTNDCKSVDYYKNKASYLPLAVDESIWGSASARSESSFDLSFIGTAWPNRISTLDELYPYIRDKNTFISVPSIIGLPVSFRNESLKNLGNSRVPVTQVSEILSNSKVSLIIGRDFSLNSAYPSISNGLQPRLFETILAGKKIWVDDITLESSKLKENEQYLRIPQELSNIDFVINENLDSIISNLKEEVLSKNTYRHRVIQIFEDITKMSDAINVSKKRQFVRNSISNVLIVNNSDFELGATGGSHSYALETEKVLKELNFEVHSFYMSKDRGEIILKSENSTEKLELSRIRDFTQLNNEEVERIFSKYLFKNNFDIIIFNHLIGLPMSLPLLAKAAGVECVYIAHDWFLLCEVHTLYTDFGGYCGVLDNSDVDCDSCLKRQFSYQKDVQISRLNFIKELVKSIDYFVVPSDFSKSILMNKLNIQEVNIKIIPPVFKTLMKNKAVPPIKSSRLFFFLGSAQPHKGIKRFIRLCEKLSNLNFDFYIFTNEFEFDKGVFHKTLPQNIKVIHFNNTDETRTNLENILSNYENILSYLCSEWPETYQITIDEVASIADLLLIGKEGAPSRRIGGDYKDRVVTITNQSDDEIINILRNHTNHAGVKHVEVSKSTFKQDLISLIDNLNVKSSSERIDDSFKSLSKSFSLRELEENILTPNWNSFD